MSSLPLFLFLALLITSEASVLILTDNGMVAGTSYPIEGRMIAQFRGIPFAEPPVGANRFKKPKSKTTKWNGILKATVPKPNCYQLGDDHSSEDCLYLDIYMPYGSKGKDVMVYFHGGSFEIGGARKFEGSYLAAKGDVIVVIPNYRLGILGFLKGNHESIPGNVGLWDQVEALKWVKENIGKFGGDPAKVTIFGESAGGMSVGFHLVTDHAQNYFDKAIMQSGSSFSVFLSIEEELSNKAFENFVQKMNCHEAQDKFDCLQKVSLTRIKDFMVSQRGVRIKPYRPTIDEEPKGHCFFCRKIFYNTNERVTVQNKPILLGSNSNEGQMFVNLPEYPTAPNTKPESLTFEQLKDKIPDSRKDLKILVDDKLFNDMDKNKPDEVRERLSQLIGDLFFVCPDKMLIEYLTNEFRNNYNKPLYYYRYEYMASDYGKKRNIDWVKGAFHGDEVSILFGAPYRFRSYSQQDRDVSKGLIEIWTSFAKTGKPELSSKLDLDFTPMKLRSYPTLHIDQDGKFKVQNNLPKNLCNDLPKKFYEQITKIVSPQD